MQIGQTITLTVVLTASMLMAMPSSGSAQVPKEGATPTAGTPPVSAEETVFRAQALTDIERFKAMRADCVLQAREAERGRQAAIANSRIPEAAAFARVLKDKLACMDHADQALLTTEALLSTKDGTLTASADRYTQRYRQGLRNLLQWLQQSVTVLKRPDGLQYEAFAQHTQQLQKWVDAFKNRYIRATVAGLDRDLSKNLFEASDVLVASAYSWKRQRRAEHQLQELERNGTTVAVAAAKSARNAAIQERARQWEIVRRLVNQAAESGATR